MQNNQINNQPETVTQASAARIRGCSREWIRQLKAQGRFRPVTTASGKVDDTLLYKDDVESLESRPAGRPRLSEEELAKRKITDLTIGDPVLFSRVDVVTPISGKVKKIGRKRIQVEYVMPFDKVKKRSLYAVAAEGNGCVLTAWVSPEILVRPITSGNGRSAKV